MGEVEDNPDTLLPSSDLVFIDAFGTGCMNMWPMSVPSSSRTGTISAVAV